MWGAVQSGWFRRLNLLVEVLALAGQTQCLGGECLQHCTSRCVSRSVHWNLGFPHHPPGTVWEIVLSLQGSHMVATLWLWSFQGLFLASCYPQWCCSTHWQRVRNQEMDQWKLILHGTSHMSLSWFFAATVHPSCLCLQGRWCHTRSLVQAGPQKFWDGVFSKISTVNYHHHLWYPIMYSNHHSCWIIRVGYRSFPMGFLQDSSIQYSFFDMNHVLM